MDENAMVYCDGCDLPLKDREGLQCGTCKGWYHYTCSNSNSWHIFLMLSTAYSHPMICRSCVEEKVPNMEEDVAAVRKIAKAESEYLATLDAGDKRAVADRPEKRTSPDTSQETSDKVSKQKRTRTRGKRGETAKSQPTLRLKIAPSPKMPDPALQNSIEPKAKDSETSDPINNGPNSVDPKDHVVKNPDPSKYKTKICMYYRRGACTKGKDCTYDHPPMCRKFKKGGPGPGGCNNKKCRYTHPTICINSWLAKECTNESCTHFHPGGKKSKVQKGSGTVVDRKKNRSKPKQPSNTLMKNFENDFGSKSFLFQIQRMIETSINQKMQIYLDLT